MKKYFLSFSLLTLLVSAEVSAFNTNSYCKKVSDAVGGSYQIEKTCRDMEHQAKRSLNNMSIPQRIENYCYRVGETVGGSYQIMKSCVDMELDAMRGMR